MQLYFVLKICCVFTAVWLSGSSDGLGSYIFVGADNDRAAKMMGTAGLSSD